MVIRVIQKLEKKEYNGFIMNNLIAVIKYNNVLSNL